MTDGDTMDAGAHYYKTDLQVHSPRDQQWRGEKPTTSADRHAYAERFVAACRRKRLRAVAITDHHDVVFVEHIKRAASSERGSDGLLLPVSDRLVVFPGVELTFGSPSFQALLILDANFPCDQLPLVLSALAIRAASADRSSHAEITDLQGIVTLRQLHETLDRHDVLRKRYVVLPNVTDGGHKTFMRPGMHTAYKEMPCVGGYIDGGKPISAGKAAIFAGRDRNYGKRRIAVLRTSDSRSDGFQALGEHPTWVKWAEPTAEALRQACLAEESRICPEEPLLPSTVVTRMRVSRSRYMGGFDLVLNPQYNAIIGGRGTGKSTCLEYLRWALCDDPVKSGQGDDLPDHVKRRERLVSETLLPFDGRIDVHLDVNGTPHVVRRDSRSGEVQLRVGQADFEPASADDIRNLMRVEAYSQRQLSIIGIRLEEVTRFVHAPIRRELEQIASREARLGTEIHSNAAAVRRSRMLAATIARDHFTVESLRQQATSIRETLSAVSADDRERLAAKPQHDAADALARGWQRATHRADAVLSSARGDIERLRADVQTASPDVLPEEDTLRLLQEETEAVLASVVEAVSSIQESLRLRTSPGSAASDLGRTWGRLQSEFESEYAEAKSRSLAHSTRLDELENVELQCRSLEANLDAQREELASLADVHFDRRELMRTWRALQQERYALVSQQCAGLTELSGGLIRASVRRSAGVDELRDRFKTAVTGSGTWGTRVDEFFQEISSELDPLLTWHTAVEHLEEIVLAVDAETSPVIPPGSPLLRGFSAAVVEKLAARLSTDALVELALTPMQDEPQFEYRTKEGEYVAFEVASAGQQATALLRVLLNQPGPPLIIDQPEDDLDSQVIQEIVEQVWEAKRQRQLIFSSHNANLVVNGDAELVVCCDHRAAEDHSGGRIKLEGAIDVPSVREEITSVMEGGEPAFRLRKEKYGF
jgi:type III restriction enzyme